MPESISIHVLKEWLTHNDIFWEDASETMWENFHTWIKKNKSGSTYSMGNLVKLQNIYGKIERKTEDQLPAKKLRTGTTKWGSATITLQTVLKPGKVTKSRIFVPILPTTLPLTVRSRKPGDTFKPLKGKGTVKLQDFFINNKIPLTARGRVPLIVSRNGEIIWVCGYRCATMPSIQTKPKKFIKITYNE